MKKIMFFFALALLFMGAAEAQEVRRLGKPTTAENTIRIVYFLEGVEEKDLEKWFSIAAAVNDSLIARPVFKKHEDGFEAVVVLTPSKQSGVTYMDSTKVRETYLGSYFENPDHIKLPEWGEQKMVALRTRLYPDYDRDKDVSVVIVNDPRFSGRYAGYAIATYRKPSDAFGVVHEIGHHFGLMDERYFSYFPTLDPFPKYPNLIKVKKEDQARITRDQIPWGHLIDQLTPIPTSFEERYRSVVGLFPVSLVSGLEYLVAQMDCIMGSSNIPFFCAACRLHLEHELERLLSIKPLLVGDFDGDGQVGLEDFFLFAEGFGFKMGNPKYVSAYDLDKDGEVGFLDFFIFVDYFGKRQ